MTAYFDDLSARVRELSSQYQHPAYFVEAVADVEDVVIKIVNLVTGDREFPNAMRVKIQSDIACWRLRSLVPEVSNPKAISFAETVRKSGLFERLHSDFHEVARLLYPTRFGLLTDSPADILRRRDTHDQLNALRADHQVKDEFKCSSACTCCCRHRHKVRSAGKHCKRCKGH